MVSGADIQPYEILDDMRPFERAKNHEKAHRTLQFIDQVFRFAVANQLAPRDPTRDLRGAWANYKPKHLAAILEPKRAGELPRAIDGYDGQASTLLALKLSPLLFVRPGELRRAEWAEIDINAALWRIAAATMKGRVGSAFAADSASGAPFLSFRWQISSPNADVADCLPAGRCEAGRKRLGLRAMKLWMEQLPDRLKTRA